MSVLPGFWIKLSLLQKTLLIMVAPVIIAAGIYLATTDSIKNKAQVLVGQVLPIVAGTYAVGSKGDKWLALVTLAYFIIFHLIGLFSGTLRFGVGLLLPIIPMLFLHPWYKGLLLGFMITSGISFIISIIQRIKLYD